MIRYIIILFTFNLLFSACGDSTTANKTPPADKTVAQPKEEISQAKYPAKPIDQLVELYKQTTFVDYSFYELPVSMSFDNPASIQQILRLLEIAPPNISGNCKPTGRAFFQRDGEDIAVAEFFLTEGCHYFIFLEDNKPVYANKLSEDGINWYKNSLSKAFQQVQSK